MLGLQGENRKKDGSLQKVCGEFAENLQRICREFAENLKKLEKVRKKEAADELQDRPCGGT